MKGEKPSIFNPNTTLVPNGVVLGVLSERERLNLLRREEALKKRPRNAQQAIEAIRLGKNVKWELLSPENVGDILRKAGAELEMPASMFRHIELTSPLDILGGRTLTGLYKFATYHPARQGQDAIPFLLEQAEVKITGEDVMDAMKKGRQISTWGQIPGEAIGVLLQKAADELKKPVATISANDFSKPLEVLGGRSLSGLFNYYYTKPERGEKDPVTFILDRVGITTNIATKVRELGSAVFFDQSSWEEIAELMKIAAAEMNKPVSMITANDIRNHGIQALGGRTLRDLKQRMDRDNVPISSLPEKIGVEVTLEDVISTAKSGGFIMWSRVPLPVFKQIVDIAAAERGKPASLLTIGELTSGFEFLSGRGLGGIRDFITRRNSAREPYVPFVLEQIGIPVTAEDVIEGIKNGIFIQWKRVPWREVKRLFEISGREIGVPPEAIGSPELFQRFNFLNDRTLGGLYSYVLRLKERNPNEPVMTFIRNKAELVNGQRPIKIGESTRSIIRRRQIQESFGKFTTESGIELSVEEMIPWIRSISRIYANPFLDINTEEIESEATVYLLEISREDNLETELVSGLHRHLEQYIRGVVGPRYREKLLSTEIAQDITLENALYSDTREGSEDISKKTLRQSLGVLSPTQRELVIGIAIKGKTLDTLSAELKMDSDTLQEVYYDALSLLRREID